MTERQYWFVPFSGESWQEFTDDGSHSLTFVGQTARRSVDVRTGDYLLCGLMGISRFVGILNVRDMDHNDSFPDRQACRCRLNVKPLIVLTPETGLPAVELRDRLDCFHASPHPHGWVKYFWQAFIRWNADDGGKVVSALLKIRQHPVKRPLGVGMLLTRPKISDAPNRLLNVTSGFQGNTETPLPTGERLSTADGRHGLVQAFFLKIGHALGFDTWIPTCDRQRKIGSCTLGVWPSVQSSLQLPVGDMAQKVLEAMDVLWFENEKVTASFAIARNGSFLLELLDIADFLALQPDAPIPFYLAAPARCRSDVICQINRAAFAALTLPPAIACRFISFNTIYRTIPRLKAKIFRLTPSLLLEISESCEPVEAA